MTITDHNRTALRGERVPVKAYLGIARCLIVLAPVIALGGCVSLQAPPPRAASYSPPVALPKTMIGPEDVASCGAEFYAYISVGALAEQAGSNSDVYETALSDLQDQLVDCLTNPPDDVYEVKGSRTRHARPIPAALSPKTN